MSGPSVTGPVDPCPRCNMDIRWVVSDQCPWCGFFLRGEDMVPVFLLVRGDIQGTAMDMINRRLEDDELAEVEHSIGQVGLNWYDWVSAAIDAVLTFREREDTEVEDDAEETDDG